MGSSHFPQPFEYVRCTELSEVFELRRDPASAILAGGTDLVPMRSSGQIAPETVIDIKAVRDLRGIARTPEVVEIGAATTMRELGPADEGCLMAIREGAGVVGAVQTRNRATLGGNICRSSPAGDTLCGLLVADATLVLQDHAGTRNVAASEFFTGPGQNLLGTGEVLTHVRVPRRAGGCAYRRFTYRRWMDLAVVGVAACLELDGDRCVDASLAIGGVAPTPLLVPKAAEVLLGTRCSANDVEQACDELTVAAAPIDDVRGTRQFRLRVLRPLARQVLRLAYERAAALPAA